MNLIIGSRGSDLALYQANLIQSYLTRLGASAEIKIIKTTGDKIDTVSFDKM
jgi:hydroxymethylbilane synthase